MLHLKCYSYPKKTKIKCLLRKILGVYLCNPSLQPEDSLTSCAWKRSVNRRAVSMCITACTLFQLPGCSLKEIHGFQTVPVMCLSEWLGGKNHTAIFCPPQNETSLVRVLLPGDALRAPGGSSSFPLKISHLRGLLKSSGWALHGCKKRQRGF